jgi:3-oxoacyl-[acyl-carrier-protein] synthase-3
LFHRIHCEKINFFAIHLNFINHGNTSAASIPMTISDYIDQYSMHGQKILLVGFGGGFTWGSAIIQL